MPQSDNKLYEAIDIWKRVSDTQLVRYRCFRVLSNDHYCVQSADYYHSPIDKEIEGQHERQWFELSFEQKPDKRSHTYKTIEEAIIKFDKGFDQARLNSDRR